MWGVIITIVAIICATLIIIDKHHSRDNHDDLQQKVAKLEQEVNDLKNQK